MNIPQLTTKQLDIIKEMVHKFYAHHIDYQTYVVPDVEQDGPNYEAYRWGGDSAAGLVGLGFLEDTTQVNAEFVAALKRQGGREWRVYTLTDLAHQMFNPLVSETIH